MSDDKQWHIEIRPVKNGWLVKPAQGFDLVDGPPLSFWSEVRVFVDFDDMVVYLRRVCCEQESVPSEAEMLQEGKE